MIFDLSKYRISQKGSFFFDTNIWLFIHDPISERDKPNWKKEKEDKYTRFYSQIKKKNDIYVSSHILSEYINTALRNDFNRKRESKGWVDFKKDYRETEDCRKMRNIIKNIVNEKILNRCKKLDENLTKDNLKKALNLLVDENKDFNDLLIAEMIKDKNIMLVTDDLDFKSFQNDYPILTYNRKFFRELS